MAEPSISLLTAGTLDSNAPRLLSSEALSRLLDLVAETYDYVVVDSPPLLAASDALVLSTEVDDVLLVARAGRTRRKELVESTMQLQDVKANLIGVTLNGLPAARGSYYYRYYDYYSRPKEPSDDVTSGNGSLPKQESAEVEQLGATSD